MKSRMLAVLLAGVLCGVAPAADTQGSDRTEDRGITQLQLAVMAQDVHGVKALLQQGGMTNAQNSAGQTALHYAVMPGQQGSDYSTHLTAALLRHGADPNIPDKQGVSPMLVAIMMDNTAVIEGLLAYGGDPNAIAFDGLSVLAVAELYGNGDIAESLRNYGARYAATLEEREILPDLKKTVRYKRELYKAWDEAGRAAAALPLAARHAARLVWPDIDESGLRVIEDQAGTIPSRKREKKVDLPRWLTPRRSCSEEEDAIGDCEEDYEDDDNEEEEEDPEWSSYYYPPQPANEAAQEVCRTVVRTVSRIVTECWPETITAVVACGTAAGSRTPATSATCVAAVGTVQRCASRTETEDVEERECD